MIEHKQRAHAILSASGAKRWINCPPSVRLEEKHGKENKTSVFAEEGTLAHEIADNKLRIKTFTGHLKDKKVLIEEGNALRKKELYVKEMEDYTDQYVDYVLEVFYGARKITPDAVLKIEERTDFSHIVPEGFGTSDANIIADNVLEVIDLKYGKGIKVKAISNEQMRLYAIGLLRRFELIYDIHEVKMTIVQPRLDHLDSETLSVKDLIEWGNETALPSAQLAFKGEGDCNPGEWCKWCSAKPVCRALHNYNMDLAKNDFADPKVLTEEEILEAYNKSNLLSDWVSAINQHILSTALEGKKWHGLKIVEGRSVRKWSEEEEVIKFLQKQGFKLEEITNTKIAGIGQVEKLVGKKDFSALDVKHNLTIRPQGKPTLAPEDDKRPAMGIEQAKNDFS